MNLHIEAYTARKKNNMADENYTQLVNQKRNQYEVVALYLRTPPDGVEYVIFTMGCQKSIQSFLPFCGGKAVRMRMGKQPLWVFSDQGSGKLLFFRATDEAPGYGDIQEEDLGVVLYLCNL